MCQWRDPPTVLVCKALKMRNISYSFDIATDLTEAASNINSAGVSKQRIDYHRVNGDLNGCFNYYTSFGELKTQEGNTSVVCLLW